MAMGNWLRWLSPREAFLVFSAFEREESKSVKGERIENNENKISLIDLQLELDFIST